MTHLLLGQVRSGAQDGIDIAALRTATKLGLPTAGTMAADYRTHGGPRPEYMQLYGVDCDASIEWAPRTAVNVERADVTARLALDMQSPGERCTLGAIRRFGRPHFGVHFTRGPDGHLSANRPEVDAAVAGVRALAARLGRPIALNVAGNSERTAPGIEAAGEAMLRVMLLRMATGLRVRTARVSYRGEDRLDVTRKSGGVEGVVFAPSWEILRAALAGRSRALLAKQGGDGVGADRIEKEAWAAYQPLYLGEMRASWMANREAWERLLLRSSVTLVCYCSAPPGGEPHCHRRLLAGLLCKLGAVDGGDV